MCKDRKEESPLYEGWRVTLAACVGVMVSFAAIVPYTFSLFIGPLHAAFGWKVEAISQGFAITAITVAFCSPWIGHLLDRRPPRQIILPSILIFSAAMMSLALLRGSIAQFYATYFVLGVVANGTAQLAYSRAVFSWFNRRRGLAFALVLSGNAVGAILMPLIAQSVISSRGWRSGYVALGTIGLLGLVLTAALVRNRPESIELTLDATQMLRLKSVLGRRAFWLTAVPVLLAAFSANSAIAHLAAMLISRGVSGKDAAVALSVLGFASIVGRLSTGFVLDRIFAPLVSAVVMLVAAAGIAVLAYASTGKAGLLGSLLIGFGAGSESDVVPYIVAKVFGRQRFATIYGFTWTAYALGAAFGPVLMGRVFDRHHAYAAGSVLMFAVPAVAAALLQLLFPPFKSVGHAAPLPADALVNVG